MSLQTKIEEKLNQSLKDKDKNLYPTLRLIVSAIKDAVIANRTKENKGLSEQDIMGLLKKISLEEVHMKKCLEYIRHSHSYVLK